MKSDKLKDNNKETDNRNGSASGLNKKNGVKGNAISDIIIYSLLSLIS